MAIDFIATLFNISDSGGTGRVAAYIGANAAKNIIGTPVFSINENLMQLVILATTSARSTAAPGATAAVSQAEVSGDGGAALVGLLNNNFNLSPSLPKVHSVEVALRDNLAFVTVIQSLT